MIHMFIWRAAAANTKGILANVFSQITGINEDNRRQTSNRNNRTLDIHILYGRYGGLGIVHKLEGNFFALKPKVAT